MAHPLVDTDPVALTLAYLSAHTDVVAAVGGAGRVRGVNEPPYPRIEITNPSSNDRDLRWVIAPVLQVAALGDLDGTPGPAALRRILMTTLVALKAWPDIPRGPGEAVVTEVRSVSGAADSPLATGQPRWISRVQLWVHPARP